MKVIENEKVLNKQRRQILQGVGVTAAIIACPSVFAGASGIAGGGFQVEGAKITGSIVSKINDPIKTLVLKNHSDHVATIESFDNGGLMFDSELIDCNSACIDQPLSLEPGQEKLVQFDFRKKSTETLKKIN